MEYLDYSQRISIASTALMLDSDATDAGCAAIIRAKASSTAGTSTATAHARFVLVKSVEQLTGAGLGQFFSGEHLIRKGQVAVEERCLAAVFRLFCVDRLEKMVK